MATTPTILIRYSQDIGLDTRMLARYVGNLEAGRSNVSVNSALSVGDKADHFRFKVTSDQFVRITTGELIGDQGRGVELAKAGTVRYQLLSGSGQVRADSDPNAGAAYEAWQDLNSATNLKLAKGTYTLRGGPGPGGDRVEGIRLFVHPPKRHRSDRQRPDRHCVAGIPDHRTARAGGSHLRSIRECHRRPRPVHRRPGHLILARSSSSACDVTPRPNTPLIIRSAGRASPNR